MGKKREGAMETARKIRLLPTPEQEQLFWKSAGVARWAYNYFLAEQQVYQAYLENGKTGPHYAKETEIRNEDKWREELRITLVHELTHHMENRSGLHALDDQDAAELAAWKQTLNQ